MGIWVESGFGLNSLKSKNKNIKEGKGKDIKGGGGKGI
jgi:hypothetical protein